MSFGSLQIVRRVVLQPTGPFCAKSNAGGNRAEGRYPPWRPRDIGVSLLRKVFRQGILIGVALPSHVGEGPRAREQPVAQGGFRSAAASRNICCVNKS
jgi:hypothetical protein